ENEQRKLRSRLATVSDREAKVREKERASERAARQEARKYLLEARAAVEAAIADVRNAAAARADDAALDDAARAARRAVEEAAAQQGAAADAVERRAERDRARRGRATSATPAHAGAAIEPERPLEPGDAVLVQSLDGKPGRVVSVRGNE